MSKWGSKTILIILSLLLCICLNACNKKQIGYNVRGCYYYNVGYWTNFTKEEHVERVTKIIEKKFKYEIDSGALLSFEVFNVYSFTQYEEPTNFCVEFSWANYDAYLFGVPGDDYGLYDVPIYSTLLGSITNDKYYSASYYDGRGKEL